MMTESFFLDRCPRIASPLAIRKCLPVYNRVVRRIAYPVWSSRSNRYHWQIQEDNVIGHGYGDWHKASHTRMPKIAWAIYHLRRKRVGQLELFARCKVYQ